MPSNTEFDPKNVNDYEKTKLNKDAEGVNGTITAGTTEYIDLTLSDDVVMAGGDVLLVWDSAKGDTIDFQIIFDNSVLSQFITDWNIDNTTVKQTTPTTEIPGKIFTGSILRLIYHSTGQNDVYVAINYNKDKVLI